MEDRAAAAEGTFVLTTGRSGSTFLARLLHSHPDVVVVSDLLEPACREAHLDPDVRLDGDGFWQLLTRPSLPERIAYWRRRPTEELLYLPDSDDDVSLLMTYTLPFLSDDPQRLRTDFEPVVRAWPTRTAPEQFTAFLCLLRDRFGGATWVERTGGSLPHATQLVTGWPTSRFVVLARDPVETALSMTSGSFFRLYLAMESGDAAGWLDDRHADPVALAAMIERWTTGAADAIDALPARSSFTLTYERLTTEPEATLAELLGFVLDRPVSAADERWAAARSADVVPAPRRAESLSRSELARVRAACPLAREAWSRLRSQGR